jgi:hypothetical protein
VQPLPGAGRGLWPLPFPLLPPPNVRGPGVRAPARGESGARDLEPLLGWMPMRPVSRCQRRAAPRGQGASPPGACHRDGDPWVRLDVPELGLPLRAVS